MGAAGVLMLVALVGPSAARAQECFVGVVGPFSLAAKHEVKVCGSNLLGTGAVSVGVATFDALDAREPLDLQFVRLEPQEGACLLARLPAQPRRPARLAVREVLVQAGAVIETAPALPPALSVQRMRPFDGDSGAADYVLWQRNFGAWPPV